MIHTLAWVSMATVAACLIAVRLSMDISPESLTGTAIGLFAWLLVILSLVVGHHQGIKHNPRDISEATARDLHVPVALLTLIVAMAHWHPRWRDLFGVLSMGLLWLVLLSLAWPGLRRFPWVRRGHRYTAHLLAAIVTLHGVQALFFVQN